MIMEDLCVECDRPVRPRLKNSEKTTNPLKIETSTNNQQNPENKTQPYIPLSLPITS